MIRAAFVQERIVQAYVQDAGRDKHINIVQAGSPILAGGECAAGDVLEVIVLGGRQSIVARIESQVMFLAQIVIQAAQLVAEGVGGGGGGAVIVVTIRPRGGGNRGNVRRWIKLQVLRRDGVDADGGDQVIGQRRTGDGAAVQYAAIRIVELSAVRGHDLRKITVLFGGRRDTDKVGVRSTVLVVLPGEKPEQLVPAIEELGNVDRSAHCYTILIEMRHGIPQPISVVKEAVGCEIGGLIKFVERAVQ